LNCNEAYFRQFKASLPDDEIDFSTVITDIEKTIYTQKFQGASADLLNANIIARDLGLSDKTELTGKDGKPLIPPARILTKEEAKDFLNKLENEY
jgi:poly(A) polymerase Pap1